MITVQWTATGQDLPVEQRDLPHRRTELAGNLARVRARIEAACAEARRDPAELTLVVVTKTFPPEDVRLLAELGITDVGENRDQEAVAKAQACADLALRWHFVGQLQTNKVRSVVSYAHVVQSVDRARLVSALDQAMSRSGRADRLSALVQVNLDQRRGRGGAAATDVDAVADRVAASTHLQLAGVMAIAPLRADPAAAFAELARIAARVRAHHPGARAISAGMSEDLEVAIAAGATHLRVGSGILGRRPSNR